MRLSANKNDLLYGGLFKYTSPEFPPRKKAAQNPARWGHFKEKVTVASELHT